MNELIYSPTTNKRKAGEGREGTKLGKMREQRGGSQGERPHMKLLTQGPGESLLSSQAPACEHLRHFSLPDLQEHRSGMRKMFRS